MYLVRLIAAFWFFSLGCLTARELLEVRNFVYWLSNVDSVKIAASDSDLAVVDYSIDGSGSAEFSPKDVKRMQVRPDGEPRILLAYLSIGEAENYRYYWKKEWTKKPFFGFGRSKTPSWLDLENPEWVGNFKVRYWEPSWQAIIYGSPDAYLDKIVAQGFDGIYLDIVDGFEFYEDTRPTAAQDMADFISEMAAYAREKAGRPFYVFAQNGERLIGRETFLDAVDGIGKEDLFYHIPTKEERAAGETRDYIETSDSTLNFSMAFFSKALSEKKLLLNIEYIEDKNTASEVVKRSRKYGFIPLIAERELDALPPLQPVFIETSPKLPVVRPAP